MPCINIQINPVGPVIEVGISSPALLRKEGSEPAAIHWIRAIADTGCSHTAIHSSVAARCGLTVISKGTSSTPGGIVATNLYHGDVFLRPLIGNKPFEWSFGGRAIVEMVQENPNFDALLGMDMLMQGVFLVNGNSNSSTFCW